MGLNYKFKQAHTHTHTLPDILSFLQYRQTDGAFLLCIFLCTLLLILLTVQLSLYE